MALGDIDLSPLYAARVFWYRADKGPWVFVLVAGLVVALLGFLLSAVFANQDERRDRARELDRQNLACLARNVYFEARGEPAAGQYAVAEVTMNRKASRRFPRTVCARSEEHTSELQSHHDLVCRLLLEKKKTMTDGRRSG